MRVAILWVLVAAAGCGYRASFADCAVRCGAGGSCPGGLSCGSDGFCRTAGGGGACADQPDAADPACAGVVCDMMMPPQCLPGDVLRTFAFPGTCAGGTCGYPHEDRACIGTCSNGACTGGWLALPQQNAPQSRFGHTAVWTGTEMIVWGGAGSSTGSYGDGARYDPVTGNWTPIATQGAPSARRDHSAVWTGHEMIVWGGASITQGTPYGDGARYDPATNTWRPLSTAGAPQARFGHTAVWTGHEMIVWGGGTASLSSLDDGARFDPATGAWTAIASSGAPSPRRDHVSVWTGSRMIVWGGCTQYAGGGLFGDAAEYDPVANTWAPSTTSNAPSDRFQHAAVWTGSEMLVWGGASSSTGTYGDGARLSLTTDAWVALPTASQPSPRRDHTAVWTGDEMIIWGGSTIVDGGSVLATGARFSLYQP